MDNKYFSHIYFYKDQKKKIRIKTAFVHSEPDKILEKKKNRNLFVMKYKYLSVLYCH